MGKLQQKGSSKWERNLKDIVNVASEMHTNKYEISTPDLQKIIPDIQNC